MKLILLVGSLLAMALTEPAMAQPGKAPQVITQSWSWIATTPSGVQTVVIPGGRGILKFNKQGEDLINTVFIDPAGNAYWLIPVTPVADGSSHTACRFFQPDASFFSADKSIELYFSKPSATLAGDSNPDAYVIGMVLPVSITKLTVKVHNPTTTGAGGGGGD